MTNIKDEQFMTNESYVDHMGQLRQVQRKTIDTFVMKEDYTSKISKLENGLDAMTRWFEYLAEERSNEAEERREEREKWAEERYELNQRIAMLEKEMYDLKNPPIKPQLNNPFDY